MIGCLQTQALAFLAVFVYATHATQAIAFEWKPGFSGIPIYGVSCLRKGDEHSAYALVDYGTFTLPYP